MGTFLNALPGAFAGVVIAALGAVVFGLVTNRIDRDSRLRTIIDSLKWWHIAAIVGGVIVLGGLTTAFFQPAQQAAANGIAGPERTVGGETVSQPPPSEFGGHVRSIGSYTLSVSFGRNQTYAAYNLDSASGEIVAPSDSLADIVVEDGVIRSTHGQFTQPPSENVGSNDSGQLCAGAVSGNINPLGTIHVRDMQPAGKLICTLTHDGSIAALSVTHVTNSVADSPLGLRISRAMTGSS